MKRPHDSVAAPVLVIVRGPPGTGKSTICRMLVDRLGYEHLEADMYHTGLDGVFRFRSWRAVDAHRWCQSGVDAAIARGHGVVVGNPLLGPWDLLDYVDRAREVIVVSLLHRYGSVHAPHDIEESMRSRFVHHDDFDVEMPRHVRFMTEDELLVWTDNQARSDAPGGRATDRR